MADLNARIKPKKSSTAGEVPQSADLEVSEIAVNNADGKLFVKHTDNSIKEISGGTDITTESIDALNDVDTTTATPTDGQVLTWVDANSQWEPADAAGGSSSLEGLSDTAIVGPASGDLLQYFVQGTATEAAIFPYDTDYLDAGGLEGSPITTSSTGGTTIDGAQAKYGGASLLIDTATGSGVVYPNTPAFDISQGLQNESDKLLFLNHIVKQIKLAEPRVVDVQSQLKQDNNITV